MKNRLLSILILLSAILINCRNNNPVVEDEKPRNQTRVPAKLETLKKEKIPAIVEYKGKFIEARKWLDTNGENYLVLSWSGVQLGSDEFNTNTKSAEYFVVQYAKNKGAFEKLWDYADLVNECQYKLWIGAMDSGIFVTDLDGDFITETTIVSRKACRNDKSPSELKLMMHEGKTRMALEGYMLNATTAKTTDVDGFECDFSRISKNTEKDEMINHYGRFQNAKDFQNKPEAFFAFARQKWMYFIPRDDFKHF